MTPAGTISDACVSVSRRVAFRSCEHFTAESPGTDFVLSESHANNPSSPQWCALRCRFRRCVGRSPARRRARRGVRRWVPSPQSAGDGTPRARSLPSWRRHHLRFVASENPGRPSRNRSCGRREDACTPTTRTPPRIAPKPSRWPARSGWSRGVSAPSSASGAACSSFRP